MILGAFSEQSFPLDPASIVPLQTLKPRTESTREWAATAHATLDRLLPRTSRSALVTQDLVDACGRPVNVSVHFGLSADRLGSLRTNWEGISHTAQAAGAGREGGGDAEAWPGFEDVWAPGHDGLPMAGRMGWAKSAGGTATSDAIVVLPGLLGDNRVLRSRDVSMGLRSCGFHVLALELRGHGATDRRTPSAAYSFSALETLDLLAVSRWLCIQPHVRRTGLIGFCWGANHALYAAWIDGCGGRHPGIAPHFARHFDNLPDARHFEAGIMAFSPVLRFEELLDKLDTKRSRFGEPALAGLQTTVRDRMVRKGYPNPSGSLRDLIACELRASKLNGDDVVAEAYRFVRLLPYRGRPDDAKLQSSRIPVLIVHAANDPLAPAQDVADLFAITTNANVAGIVLPGGGHIGFAAYAREYFYNLMVGYMRVGE